MRRLVLRLLGGDGLPRAEKSKLRRGWRGATEEPAAEGFWVEDEPCVKF
jgi:hypothetical protein